MVARYGRAPNEWRRDGVAVRIEQDASRLAGNRQRPPMRGVRAGAIVLAGVATLNVGNYLFHVIAARHLGPARYGDLATLITIASLISLPLAGVQVWVARNVARFVQAGDLVAAHWFSRRVAVYLVVVGSGSTLLLLLLTWTIQDALGIASPAAVAITALTALPAIVSPVTWGVSQGLERFSLVAVVYAAGPVARIAFTLIAFAIGLQVGGAMLATLASMLVALGLPLFVLRDWFRPAPQAGRRIDRRAAFWSLLPVMIGLLAITALTSDDVVVAKAALSEHEAGIYGSASLIGRVILYLPAAVITVLLPRVAARTADRRESLDLLAKSLGVTAAFSVIATAIYTLGASPIIRVAFGARYADAAPLLWRFAVAMSGYALLNVLLVYHLGRDNARMAWALAVGAVAQLFALIAFHRTSAQLVEVDMVFAALLIVSHEALHRGLATRAALRLLRPG